MKARIPTHREFHIKFPDDMPEVTVNEGLAKLEGIMDEFKKSHNGESIYHPEFIEACEPGVKALQEEYKFEYEIATVR